MKLQHAALSLFCCFASPLFAQTTTIGGGTCSSATLNGTYALMVAGRGVTGTSAAATLTNVLDAVGSVTFDGLSKATFSLTANTNQAIGTPLNWGGNYSVQANCQATVTITSGGSATFNLVIYAGGSDFLMTGSDSTYAYSASGNTQPASCSASLLSGVYSITAQGYYSPTSTTVGGAGATTGVLQFDGVSNFTANVTFSANGILNGQTGTVPPKVYTGTYTMSSNCVGMATGSSGSNTGTLVFSVYGATKTAISAMYVSFAAAPALLTGTANAIYGQPTTTPAIESSLTSSRTGRADEPNRMAHQKEGL